MVEENTVSDLDKAIESAKILLEQGKISKKIKRKGDEWCVYSEDGSSSLGCYPTKKKAQERLRQVEHFSKALKEGSPIRKGLPAQVLEGGIHLHALERENSRSKTDGAHSHVFLETKYIRYDDESTPEKVENILVTNEDGIHYHMLGSPTSDDTNMDGEHSHTVYSYELDEDTWEVIISEMETTEDGRHGHGLQVATSNFDGLHTHNLEMSDGSVLASLTPGQVWEELCMMTPQAGQIPLPPSSLFATLSDEQRAIMNALYMIDGQGDKAEKSELNQEDTTKAADQKPQDKDFSTGVVQTLKLPNPGFVIERLKLCKPAGMISKKNHKVRVGKEQGLVNELAPMDYKNSFLWGIVKHEETELFKRLSDMPEEIIESVDPIMRAEFEREEDIYYLPISAVKIFNEPKKLDAPPLGRRFAGKIDLRKNIVSVLKCSSCETPFEDIGRSGVPFCPRCRASNAKVTKFLRPERDVQIVKSEENSDDERYVFGVVLVPDIADAQGDIYTAEEVKKAAHSFMEVYGGNLKLMHRGETLDDVAKVLETYITKNEESFDNVTYPKGTWLLATRIIDDGLWKQVRSGEFTGYSIGGTAIREPLA